MLLDQGWRVAVLSRGYGGSCEGEVRIVSDGKEILLSARECGDEPFLLASTIPGLMVVMGADRHAAGQLAMERLQPDVFLLDDGFQHLQLQRDLNILLLDYARPFGNGCCLPAGLLREPRSAVDRADLVIHTRCPEAATVVTKVSGKPSCAARHVLKDLVPFNGGGALGFEALRGKKVLACAGIAEPEGFFEELRARGVTVVAALSFPDHVAYDDAGMNHIASTFRNCGADLLLTTEKDGVKLYDLPSDLLKKTMLCRLTLQIDNPTPLADALRNLLQK
jgi:tetraacyldisaccharide 4'-kinase